MISTDKVMVEILHVSTNIQLSGRIAQFFVQATESPELLG